MSEEEQEAIEYWKRDIEFYRYNTQLASEHYAQILLNLIDKLQKENEQYEEIKNLISKEKLFDIDYIKEFFIDKEKIRNKIKELEKAPLVYELTIDTLKELLEEE